MSIREKIMELEPPTYYCECYAQSWFDDGLERAADIAEAEVEGLLLGIKMLEARVRELEGLLKTISMAKSTIVGPGKAIIHKALYEFERVIGGER